MKKYLFVHYEPKTKLEDVANFLEWNYQDWTVVSHSCNENGITILLMRVIPFD